MAELNANQGQSKSASFGTLIIDSHDHIAEPEVQNNTFKRSFSSTFAKAKSPTNDDLQNIIY